MSIQPSTFGQPAIKTMGSNVPSTHQPQALKPAQDSFQNSSVRFGGRLHDAAACGDVTAVVQSIKAGDDINAQDAQGQTALHKAAENRYAQAVTQLLENNADVAIVDHQGQTALHKAAAANARECARQLLGKGADIDAQDNDGQTPRQLAPNLGWEELAQ